MAIKREGGKVVISPVNADETEDILNLYARIFSEREPLMRGLGFSADRIAEIARVLYMNRNNDSLNKGLWFKATGENDSNAPAGFVVCSDLTAESPTEPPRGMTPEEMAKVPSIMALLEAIRRPLDERYSLEPGDCLHISALGVAPGWEGMGVATKLLAAALERGSELGFKYAASETTSPPSRRCHEKCGFRSLGSLVFEEFEFEGERPFKHIEGECHLMVRELRL